MIAQYSKYELGWGIIPIKNDAWIIIPSFNWQKIK
jgi:hypothetical protein